MSTARIRAESLENKPSTNNMAAKTSAKMDNISVLADPIRKGSKN